MQKIICLTTVLLILALATLACATSTQPASQENVETVVAETMFALTPDTSKPVEATSPPPSGTSGLLPHTLYYLNADSAGFLQVYRLETDGKTVSQITFEPANVDTYDVSPVDGSVAYSSNNQLLLVNADGSNRRVLVDGGTLSSDESYITSRVGSVAWSPDGKTIAFGFGGLNFFALETGAINKVLENWIDKQPDFSILREGYSPAEYAPDGSKLLVNIGYYEGGVYAMYYLGGNTLVRSEENAVTCCRGSWAPDGNAYYAASPYLGMITPGLWRINADGTVNDLITNDYSGDTFEFAQSPIVGPDGMLYYFYNKASNPEELSGHLTLYMVRSATDGVSGRTNIFPTPIENLNEVLWAPDASFAILAVAPVKDIYRGGQTTIQYTDGRPSVELVSFAQDMSWGP